MSCLTQTTGMNIWINPAHYYVINMIFKREERNVECEKFNRLQDIFGLDIAGDGLMSELLFYKKESLI